MSESGAGFDRECFLIAPIGPAGSEIRERSDQVLQYIVRPAAERVDLRAVRADELAEPGEINQQVIQHVLGARAAVADLTGTNANVYYEMGIRHTARLPTVLIAAEGEKLPFDIVQMRTIFFNYRDLASVDEAREAIVRHLRAALEGAVGSPISTTVNLRHLQSGSAQEQVIAQLTEAIGDLQEDVTGIREFVHVMAGVGFERPYEGLSLSETRQLIAAFDDLTAIVRGDNTGQPPLRQVLDDLWHVVDDVARHHGISIARP